MIEKEELTDQEDSSYAHSILLLGWKPPMLPV